MTNIQETQKHPIQQALAESRGMFVIHDGELTSLRHYRSSYKDNLAREWTAAMNGYTVPNHILNEAYGYSATANSAANYRADKASTAPLKVTDRKNNDLGDATPAQWFMDSKARILWHIEMALELWGVAYLIKRRGFPFWLEWVPTDWVQIDRDLSTGEIARYYIRDVVGHQTEYKAADVIRIATFDPMMSDNGKSHFETAMARITTEKGLMRFSASFFLNSARPDGILLSKSRMSEDEMRKAEENWKMFKGAENAFQTFVSSGEWEWIAITPPPIDLELGTLDDTTTSAICKIFQVNPVLIGAGQAADALSAQSTYRSIERAHVDGVTVPRMEFILGELNRQWLWIDFPQKNFYTLKIDKQSWRVLSDVNQEVMAAAQTGVISGVLDYDEARESAGLEPRDSYYFRRNPTDALAAFVQGGILMDEFRHMMGLPPLPGQQGLVILSGGQLIPAEQIRAKALQNVQPPPSPQPQLPFALSDMERSIRAILTEAQVHAARSAPVSGLEALAAEIRSMVTAFRDVMAAAPQTVAPVTVPVQVYAPIAGHAFVTYIQRQLSSAMTEANILDVTYADPQAWSIPLLNASVPADRAAQILRHVDLDGQFAFDAATVRLQAHQAAEDQPIIVSLLLEGRGLQQLHSSMALMAQGAGVVSDAVYPAAVPLAMLSVGTDQAVLADVLSKPVMAYTLAISKIAARAGDTAPMIWELDGLTPEQTSEFRVWRSKVEKKGRGVEFEFRALRGHRPTQWAQLALRMGLDTKSVFDTAHKWARAALPLDDKDANGVPDLYESYWSNYDKLLGDIGEEWLDTYMGAAWDTLQPHVTPNLSESDVGEVLRANHDALTVQWVGEDKDHPGPLTKLILAGMAAGQQSLIDNTPADYRAAFRAVDVTVDWNLMSVEAFKFAQTYGFDMIKGIDATTRAKVSGAMLAWINAGEDLDQLSARMEKIFKDPVRAKVIAETESIRAYTQGAQERWRQANVTEAVWHTVRDSHVCKICAPLHGTRSNFDSGWTHLGGIMTGPDGSPIDTSDLIGTIHTHPAHPGCRCFGRPVVSEAMSVLPPTTLPATAAGVGVKAPPAKPPPKVAKVEMPIVTDYADVSSRDTEAVRQWGVKQFRAFQDSLSTEQKDAVYTYTTGEYRGINGRLRRVGWAKDDASYDDTIKKIDTVFPMSRAPMNIITYRGMAGWEAEYKKYWDGIYSVGSVFADKGYCSTSLAAITAGGFGSGKYILIYRCFVRKDVPSVYCGYTSKDGYSYANPHECEVLLGRGQRFRITSIAKPTKYGEAINIDLVALFTSEKRAKPMTPNDPKPRDDQKPEGDYQPGSKFWDNEPDYFVWEEVVPEETDPAQGQETDEE